MAKIHFLNVGHGECTVIEHNNGNLTVIDINNGSDDMDNESVDEIAKSASERDPSLESSRTLWRFGLLSESQLLSRAGYTVETTNPISFLHEKYPNEQIFRYIQTHPDFDHLRGLAHIRDGFSVLNFWDHPHSKTWDGEERVNGDADHWNAY